jgi:hypothetical protein
MAVPFLRTVGDQGRGIDIHNGAVEKAQPREKFSSEFVVQSFRSIREKSL